LEIAAFCVLSATFIIVIISLILKISATSVLNDLQAKENDLVADLKSPENAKKETLYFLIKNRIVKIGDIDKSRLKLAGRYLKLLEINNVLTFDSVNLVGNSVEIDASPATYDLFDDFINNLGKWGIVKDSLTVDSTKLTDGKAKISFKFSFK